MTCAKIIFDTCLDDKINDDAREGKMCCYRTRLEQEVSDLLNLAAFCIAQELLDDIATLETTISKLEEELASLQLQLRQERTERHLAENHLEYFPSFSPESPTSSSCLWEEVPGIQSLQSVSFTDCS
ncbi:hypothetical protein B296_00052910 [Ensete ventricosum]|uniref:Ternary complex factor MIP1 leucine-zipper domain-containing protein n=1 Tax=Ensete ventricosum TaxID=4639 RepID=A0A426X7D4_ENSVE|nr:hypothetical protein B296_00052910 [Ensete ventricosum]